MTEIGSERPRARFSVKKKDSDRFDVKFPYFREPTELGRYCLDGERCYVPGKGQARYLYLPEKTENVCLDLNVGYNDTVKKGFALDEKLDNLLKWIAENRTQIPRTDSKNEGFAADFVCFRGLLTAIICTPYEDKDPWIICATKYQGTIYLCQFDTEQKKERESSLTERDKQMSSWGYKFEQYLTTNEVGQKPDTSIPVNENEESCCVVRTRLGDHSLLYGAEMDCEDPSSRDRSNMEGYIELKTSRHITSPRQERTFKRYKLMKWWAQSFLIGIRQIICGFRDDNGIVRTLQTYDVASIPKSTREFWQANVLMNFGDQFLAFVKTVVQKDDKNVVYKFELRPGFDVVWEELPSTSSFHFLPTWYTK